MERRVFRINEAPNSGMKLGPYEIIERLGTGGMLTIWCCIDRLSWRDESGT
jgi:hypothetical protein